MTSFYSFWVFGPLALLNNPAIDVVNCFLYFCAAVPAAIHLPQVTSLFIALGYEALKHDFAQMFTKAQITNFAPRSYHCIPNAALKTTKRE